MGLRHWISWLPGVLVFAASASADIVQDGRGSFGDVEIIGFNDDTLAFRMNDGRLVSRPALSVKYIQVFSSHDRMGETLSEAERLSFKNDPMTAIGLYRQVATNARVAWFQDFAEFRLAQIQDKLGAFPAALEAYLLLNARAPQVAALVIPRNLPAPGTPQAAEAIDAIKQAERQSPPEDVAAVLVRLRHRIIHGDQPEAPTSKPATKRAPGGANPKEPGGSTAKAREAAGRTDARRKPAPASQPSGPAVATNKPRRPTSAAPATQPASSGKLDGMAKLAHQAIVDGNLDLAAKTVERAKTYAKGGDRPVWLLMNAELLVAQKHFGEAGVAAMRVVVEYANSPNVAAGLYWTGQAYEGLGRSAKAVELYEEASRTPRIDEMTRLAALDRIKALQQPSGMP